MNYFFFNEILKHGISNPITSILISTDLALQKIRDNPEQTINHIEQIQITAQYIQKLLRRESLNQGRKFFIETAIKEILIINSGYKRNLIYSFQNSLPEGTQIKGNKILFQELLICLLNNADESYKTDRNKTVLVTTKKENKKVVISVTDGGVGMSWLEKNLALNKNFSMKENHSGHGLYLVKRIIEEEFLGKIELITEKNRGTTIKCFFPLN